MGHPNDKMTEREQDEAVAEILRRVAPMQSHEIRRACQRVADDIEQYGSGPDRVFYEIQSSVSSGDRQDW